MVRKDIYTLAQFENIANFLNLSPVPTKTRIDKKTGERLKVCSKKDYLKSIQEYFLKNDDICSKKFLRDFMSIEKLKRAYSFKDLNESERNFIINSDDYLIERQLGGLRFCLYWSYSDRVLELYPEAISKDNYLPKDCSFILDKNKFIDLLIKNSIEDFCIIGEILPYSIDEYKSNEYYGGLSDIVLDLLDRNNNIFDYIVYFEDILYYGNINFDNTILVDRYKYLDLFSNIIFSLSNVKMIDKYNCSINEAYNRAVSFGYEGIVLKNKSSLYNLDGKLNKDWIKMSSPKNNSLLSTVKVYAFITGYYDDKIILGTYLSTKGNIMLTNSGNKYICNIFTLKNISNELSCFFFSDGLFNNTNYGKVVMLNIPLVHGEDNISNATFGGFDYSKSMDDCIIDKDYLNEVILF